MSLCNERPFLFLFNPTHSFNAKTACCIPSPHLPTVHQISAQFFCLDPAKNDIRTDELKIINENNKKNSDLKNDVILNGENIIWNCMFEIVIER
jgi:hypothetical protein